MHPSLILSRSSKLFMTMTCCGEESGSGDDGRGFVGENSGPVCEGSDCGCGGEKNDFGDGANDCDGGENDCVDRVSDCCNEASDCGDDDCSSGHTSGFGDTPDGDCDRGVGCASGGGPHSGGGHMSDGEGCRTCHGTGPSHDCCLDVWYGRGGDCRSRVRN
ncbi:hypothetical protein B0T11DRAFT_300223 [Plectosphaerella cucumerina]|uniref:Uncharacterized protein n=1 Tax=Plectosphaerella cucumerina TaxID=40658 RepID=A0A8K0TIS2_9PEZI|nr:hypothetical protein B0T11DRAFT_300223 [Plectosphaerella cucumerina]